MGVCSFLLDCGRGVGILRRFCVLVDGNKPSPLLHGVSCTSRCCLRALSFSFFCYRKMYVYRLLYRTKFTKKINANRDFFLIKDEGQEIEKEQATLPRNKNDEEKEFIKRFALTLSRSSCNFPTCSSMLIPCIKNGSPVLFSYDSANFSICSSIRGNCLESLFLSFSSLSNWPPRFLKRSLVAARRSKFNSFSHKVVCFSNRLNRSLQINALRSFVSCKN